LSKLKKQALTGVIWNGIQLVINQSFGFIIKLVLAKLLFPEQFGLVGMATVFTGFVQVFNDLGIGAALIQRKEEDLKPVHYHTAFWTGVGWSFLMYLIMALMVGPLAAQFYEEPLLKKLVPVLGLGVLFSPINLIHKAQLTKKMNFKRMAFIENTATIISGSLALLLAYLGAGVWTLVFNAIATMVFAMPYYFISTKWLPKLIYDKTAFKEVFGFGIFTTGTNIVNYLISNVDYLLIGKFVSSSALGAYTFAFVLTNTFRGRLMAVMNRVFYPLYSKMQDNPDTLKKYYLKVVNYNSVIIFPIMVFFILLADPVIIRVFGEKWIDSISPLQILSASVMVHMMVNSNTSLIRGIGRPDLEFKIQLVKAILFVPVLILGVLKFGIVGAAYATLINKVMAVIIAQYTFNKLLKIKISTLEFLKAVKQPWIASFISFIICYFLLQIMDLNYIITSILFFILYALSIWWLMKAELASIIKELKQLKTKKI
jgi:O-antigen/teichoic acid export membrane protein